MTAAREQAASWVAQVYERRDSGPLLVGFAGAFRDSELSGLTGTDVELHAADVHGLDPIPRHLESQRAQPIRRVRINLDGEVDVGGWPPPPA